MANPEHLAALEKGVKEWNEWLGSQFLDLEGADLRERDLRGAILRFANFRGANLVNANLSRNALNDAQFDGADLSGAQLNGADLSSASLRNANLSDADLTESNLRRSNFEGATLKRAILGNADLTWASLATADLAGATLIKANLEYANLNGVQFVSNTDKYDDVRLVAQLLGANLSHARLTNTSLRNMDLRSTQLCGTDLSGLDLSGTDLRNANLTEADLTYANLTGAKLNDEYDPKERGYADPAAYPYLHGPLNVTRARFNATVLASVDLRGVMGLNEIEHLGPSMITIDTLIRSRGEIPEVFLRNAGVPDPFIINLKALIGAMELIQFYSVFISYSTADEYFAERLYADLQTKGIRCWFAPHDIQGGKKIHEQIDEAIRLYDKLLLILSPNSMESEWVKTEIAKARKREIRDKVRTLFPIRLVSFEKLQEWECFDADTRKDSAREIREYFIPDFSNWKDHDSYRKAFDGLLRDLQATAQVTK